MGGAASREPAYWEENSELIKQNFVAVALDGRRAMTSSDEDSRFLRETCGVRLRGAGANIFVITASGKLLGPMIEATDLAAGPNRASRELRHALAEWKSMPASSRQVAPRVPVGSTQTGRAAPVPVPPTGGLILKEYYRVLSEEPGGKLRHAIVDDFVHAEKLAARGPPREKRHFLEAAPDFVWLSEAEWKSLIPANPVLGTSARVPANIAERIFRFHLVPAITFGESNGWSRTEVRGGELRVIVEEASQERIRLRLEGFARLGADYPTAEKVSASGGDGAYGYEPQILGYLAFDASRQRLDRFDMIALGDFYGTLRGDGRNFYRPGRTPLGVAFELVNEHSPAADWRVAPRGAQYPEDYFGWFRRE